MSPLLPKVKLEGSFHVHGGQTLESTVMIGLELEAPSPEGHSECGCSGRMETIKCLEAVKHLALGMQTGYTLSL